MPQANIPESVLLLLGYLGGWVCMITAGLSLAQASQDFVLHFEPDSALFRAFWHLVAGFTALALALLLVIATPEKKGALFGNERLDGAVTGIAALSGIVKHTAPSPLSQVEQTPRRAPPQPLHKMDDWRLAFDEYV